jgi:hypothetical protein
MPPPSLHPCCLLADAFLLRFDVPNKVSPRGIDKTFLFNRPSNHLPWYSLLADS